jgi:hypothetical protein
MIALRLVLDTNIVVSAALKADGLQAGSTRNGPIVCSRASLSVWRRGFAARPSKSAP